MREDGGASSSSSPALSPEEPHHRHPPHEEEDKDDSSRPHHPADDDDNVNDEDASHHHHVAAELATTTATSEFLSKIRRQLVYAAILLGCLVAIGQSSSDTNGSSVTFFFVAEVAHEPSVRIFRALLEVALLLACTAFSIAVWARFLSHQEVAELLFQAPDASGNTNIGNNSTVHSGVSSSDADEEDRKRKKRRGKRRKAMV